MARSLWLQLSSELLAGEESKLRPRSAHVKNFLQWLITLVVVMTVIIGAERVPSLKKADIFTEQHHRPLVAVTLPLTIVGFLLFMGGVIYGSMQGGRPLTHNQIQHMTREVRYPQAFFCKTWFRGKSWGRGPAWHPRPPDRGGGLQCMLASASQAPARPSHTPP